MKGVAELLGVPETPWFDRVITWGQELIGKCYLVDGKLTGPDVATSAAPQRFGHKSIEDLIVFRPASLPASAIDNLHSKAQAARFVRTAGICAGLPCDSAAAAQADEAEALAAAIADGEADDYSAFEVIEDIRNMSFDARLASITSRAPSALPGRSFMRQSSTRKPLGLDREASAVLAANLQSALHLAGISSFVEQRGASFAGRAKGLGSAGGGSGTDRVASLTHALHMLGSVAEQDAETMEALVDEDLAE
eukprot:GHRQ01001198.1.p1 GENE.GHRQ01001198.1~~GHRQ01001198.1.p1  ORF type:complete len:251 (+),score=120.79 GHRQ01001198.1:562-1314(+)